MKKTNLIAISLIFASLNLIAQTPQTLNYQAIARSQDGALLGDQSLTIRIGIIQNTNLIWQEDHQVTTTVTGHFHLNIGDPDALNPLGSVGSFAEIPWGDGDFQLQVSVDDGNGFNDLGSSVLASVPYALYAADGPGGTGPQGPQGEPGPPGPAGADEQSLNLDGNLLTITGGNSVDLSSAVGSGSAWNLIQDTISTFNHVGIGTSTPNQSTLSVQGINTSESPLFEVKREDGFPVFAVYNDGVMVYVDEEAKGVKGGFAVGGFRRSSKGITQEYLTVSRDSVRIYVPNEDLTTGAKGGFAVGGFRRSAEGPAQDLLFVNSDSTRVYVPNKGNDPGVAGLQGGFAVSSYEIGAPQERNQYLMGINKGITRFNAEDRDRGFAIGSQGQGQGGGYDSFLEVTPTNSFLGASAGINNMQIDTADENGWGLGTMNVFVGYQSGMENVAGHHNTFLGFCAGTKTTGSMLDADVGSHNVFVGSQAGFRNTIGFNNVYLGFHAGINNEQGEANIFIGDNAGFDSDASSSILIGNHAGTMFSLNNATYIGTFAGYNSTGLGNTYIGADAGAYSGIGENNTALGMHAMQYGAGNGNVVIGKDAGTGESGVSTFYDNVVIGLESGNSLTNGYYNVIIGPYAGQAATGARGNVFLGYNSGFSYVDGWSNTFVGGNSGFSTVDGVMNTFYGNQAGYKNVNGDRNTNLGHSTGYNNTAGSGNIFIGYHAGYNETGSNKLYIDNSNTGSPLIYGDMDGNFVEFNGNVTVYGSFNEVSDANLKTNIVQVTDPLDKIKQINGVSFDWKESEERKRAGTESSIGFLAQEVETVFPDLVTEDRKGTKAVNYSGMIPVLLEAIKEQQSQIEILEQRLAELEKHDVGGSLADLEQ